jgi:hypothetical protein
MEASEYKIGNWIIDHEAEPETTIYWQVEQICTVNGKEGQLGVRFRNGSCWTALEYVEPVQINSEWLVRFGFYVGFRLRGVTIYSLDISGITLQLKENGNVSYVSVGIQRIDDGSLFKNINQIQNLHHDLTGKELELVDPSDIHFKTNNK